MTFTNRKIFIHQTLELLSDGIKISKKTVFDFLEYEIPYDQISNKKKIVSTISDGMLISGISFIGLGFLLWGFSDGDGGQYIMGLGLLIVLLTFIRRKRFVVIQTYSEGDITLYYNRKNREEIIDLANQIIASCNSYLMNKFGKVDKALPIDPQLDNLQFLRNRGILNEEDYESLKNQLLGREHKSSIGFKM